MIQTEETGSPVPPELLDTPNGMYAASVDKKGRLKLPVVFQRYLKRYPEETLFATSLDGIVGALYPISIWKRNKVVLAQNGGKNMLYVAQTFGQDTEMDAEGRVLLPTDLRRKLGVEDQQVRLLCVSGRIEILSEAVHQQRLEAAMEGAQADLEALERAGFL